MRGWRYAATLGGMIVVIGGGAALSFRAIESRQPERPEPVRPVPPPSAGVTSRPVPAPAPALPSPAPAPSPMPPPARRVTRPRPTRSSPPRERVPVAVVASPSEPGPDPRKGVIDSAYRLSGESRPAEALAVLGRWLVGQPDDQQVRAEVARLAIQVGDYSRAAREFDLLSAADPVRLEWRLGAAQARVWDGRYREGLQLLGDQPAPRGSELSQVRRQARIALDLTVAEATAWVVDDSSDVDARLALARALARNGQSAAALPSYQLAVQSRPSAALWSEIAGVASAVPDSTTVAKALAQAVALAPTDAELRRRYALALAWIGDQPGALAQLDQIIGSSPSVEALGARADLERWQGHRRRARADYRRALALDPAFAPARAGLDQLGRDLYRDVAWVDDEGSGARALGRGDSEGFRATTVRIAHGVPVDPERSVVVTGAVELRRVERRPASPSVSAGSTTGWAGELGLSRRFDAVRLNAGIGSLWFTDTPRITTWRLGAEGDIGAAGWRLGLGRTPAYETLRSGVTLGAGPLGGTGRPLVGTAGDLTVSRSFGQRFELWSRAEYLGLGDGNDRVTLETSLRFGLVPDLYLVYGGGLLRFADPVTGYWSPDFFTLHSLGLELRRQWPTGLRLSAQALPGVAWAQEPGAPLTDFDRRTFQWQLGGQLGYQRPRWDLGLEGAWGRDRGGIYSSWWWSLRARYRW